MNLQDELHQEFYNVPTKVETANGPPTCCHFPQCWKPNMATAATVPGFTTANAAEAAAKFAGAMSSAWPSLQREMLKPRGSHGRRWQIGSGNNSSFNKHQVLWLVLNWNNICPN